MATLKDLLASGMSRDEINALLSQSYVGTDGFQQAGYEQGPPVAQEYPPSDMLPQPQYRGESMASQPMRQFIQQPVPQSGTMTQQDADDARAYAKHVMETGGVDAHGRPTSTYTSPQQFRSQKQLPQNYIQNERTGRVMDMGQSQPAGPAMDYSMPIEIGGYGKGYRLKGDATRAVLADGRIVDMGRDTQEERKRRLADAEIAKREAEVRNLNERPKETGTWSTVESNGKQYLINNKTGAIKPAEVGGEQLMGKKSDAASKKESQMEGLGDAISQAKAILEGSAPDQKALPTGSGIGSIWDSLAGQVGATPAGATEAQRMKVLGGALTSKMPRMEGPQSDKDTQLYKEMAGLVGDDTVPIQRRLDALDQVSKLWLKYEKAKPAATAYDAEKEARYQEWKKARGM